MSFSCSSHILVITSRGLIPAEHGQPSSAHADDTVCKKSTQKRCNAEDCLCISRDQGKPVQLFMWPQDSGIEHSGCLSALWCHIQPYTGESEGPVMGSYPRQ